MSYKNDHVKVLKALAAELPKRSTLDTSTIASKTFKGQEDADRRVRNAYRMLRKYKHIEIADRGDYRLTQSGAEFCKVLEKNNWKVPESAQPKRPKPAKPAAKKTAKKAAKKAVKKAAPKKATKKAAPKKAAKPAAKKAAPKKAHKMPSTKKPEAKADGKSNGTKPAEAKKAE